MEVDRSDLEKVHDILVVACNHHMTRDASNAHLHLADSVRHSPLTSELQAAEERLRKLLEP